MFDLIFSNMGRKWKNCWDLATFTTYFNDHPQSIWCLDFKCKNQLILSEKITIEAKYMFRALPFFLTLFQLKSLFYKCTCEIGNFSECNSDQLPTFFTHFWVGLLLLCCCTHPKVSEKSGQLVRVAFGKEVLYHRNSISRDNAYLPSWNRVKLKRYLDQRAFLL